MEFSVPEIYGLILPIFNNGKFFCWTNMAWCLLALIWISGFLLACMGFEKGGKLSIQIFLAAWTIFFVNNWLNSFFSANESLLYFEILYLTCWIVMIFFRLMINQIGSWIGKTVSIRSPRLLRFISVLCGIAMILTVIISQFEFNTFQFFFVLFIAFLSGFFGWWYQAKNQKKSIHFHTYEDLDQLEKKWLYE